MFIKLPPILSPLPRFLQTFLDLVTQLDNGRIKYADLNLKF